MMNIRVIFSLFLALTIGLTAMNAQNPYATLEKELEQYRQERRPRKVAETLKKIRVMAESRRDVPMLLHSMFLYDDPENDINDYPEEPLMNDLDKLMQASWLRPVDRAMILFMRLRMYVRYGQFGPAYMMGAVHGDPKDNRLSLWSEKQFEDAFLRDFDAFLSYRKALLQARTEDFRPLFESQPKKCDAPPRSLYQSCISVLALAVGSSSEADGKISHAIEEELRRAASYLSDRREQLEMETDRLDYEKRCRKLDDAASYRRMDELIAAYSDLPDVIGMVDRRVNAYCDEEEYVSALDLCNSYLSKYPEAPRINLLKSSRASRILASFVKCDYPLRLHTRLPKSMRIASRNVGSVLISLYWLDMNGSQAADIRQEDLHLYAKGTPFWTESIRTQGRADMKMDSIRCTLPDLPKGVYLVKASAEQCVLEKTKPVPQYSLLHVSDLFFLAQQAMPGVQILDALTGKPVEGASVDASMRYSIDRSVHTLSPTDRYGRINLRKSYNRFFPYTDGDRSYPVVSAYTYKQDQVDLSKKNERKYIVSTDRAIYRPGQEVHFFGQCDRIGYAVEDARAIGGSEVEVVLEDANSKEIGRLLCQADEMGRFSGSFDLPTGILNGLFGLRVGGDTYPFSVEEYKRPTFEVGLRSPDAAYAMGDTLRTRGEAKTFTGIGMRGATVNYRLSLTPYTRRWWGRPVADRVVQTGEAVVDESGYFVIPVSLSRPEGREDYSYCLYTLSADVTAPGGETQTAVLRIPVGKEPKRVDIEVGKYIRANEDNWLATSLPDLTFTLTNTSGQTVEGSIAYFLCDADNERIGRLYTAASGVVTPAPAEWGKLPSGQYRLRFGESGGEVSDFVTKDIYLFRLKDRQLSNPSQGLWTYVAEEKYDSHRPARILVGAAPKDADAQELYLFYDLTQAGRFIEREMIACRPGEIVEIVPMLPAAPLPESMNVSLYYVYGGRLYSRSIDLERRLPKREIKMSWSTFRDKLRPGEKETWKLRLADAEGKPLSHTMMAAWMYDAALDKIVHSSVFSSRFFSFADSPASLVRLSFPNSGYRVSGSVEDSYVQVGFKHPVFKTPQLCLWSATGYRYVSSDYYYDGPMIFVGYGVPEAKSVDAFPMAVEAARADAVNEAKPKSKESRIQESSVRTNFAETAFFEPALLTDERGEVSWSFSLPETLTRWHLLLFAHTKDMRLGMKDESVEVRKDFMLTPNLPRFLRMGDKGTASASIRNESETMQQGFVRMELFDPATDKLLGGERLPFSVEAGGTVTVSFPLDPVSGYDALGVRLLAESHDFSDGEQHSIVQLPATERVVETIPLILYGGQSQTVDLDSLFPHRSGRPAMGTMALQVVSNPLWVAVQALPVMIDVHEEDAVSVASALYANSIAAALVSGRLLHTPALGESLRHYLAQPLDTLALQKSPLSSDELPWRAEMLAEQNSRQRLQALVASDRLTWTEQMLTDKLKRLQKSDGSWAWHPEMSSNDYLTDYVMTMLVRLSALTAAPEHKEFQAVKRMGWNALDDAASRLMDRMKEYEKKTKSKYKILPERALNYLYLLTIDSRNPSSRGHAARMYFLDILGRSLPHISILDMPRAAIVLHGVGRKALADDFLRSIREHIIRTPDQGAHFALPSGGYYWCDRRYGMQTEAIEAFARIGTSQDSSHIEGLQMWLLNQKRTQLWPSLPASSDAIYALLLGAGKDRMVETTVSVRAPVPALSGTFAGAGESRIVTVEDLPQGKLSAELARSGKGFAWASFLAEYDAPAADLVATGNGLSVEKHLFSEQVIDGKVTLVPLREGDRLEVGKRLVTQLTITLDRDMDFIVLTDKRAAAVEPIGQLSGYDYAAGTFYYREIKDSSTRFYFDRLVRGSYKLQYSTVVVRSGAYASGIATVSSAYAPEFTGHTDGGRQLQTVPVANTQ